MPNNVLAETIQNLFTYSENFNLWTNTGTVTVFLSNQSSPDGGSNAQLVGGKTDSEYFNQSTTFSSGSTVTMSGYVKKKVSSTTPRFVVEDTSNIELDINWSLTSNDIESVSFNAGSGTATFFEVGDDWWRVSLTITLTASSPVFRFTPVSVSGPSTRYVYTFGFQVSEANQAIPYAKTEATTLSSDNNLIFLLSEYNGYKRFNSKIENSHRVRDGGQYNYRWGEFYNINVPVKYVTNYDATKINSWWGGGEELRYFELDGFSVSSVQIRNKTTPLAEVVKPYYNLYKGVIKLETY